jgi:integrase
MGTKITDRLIEKLPLPQAGWQITYDNEVTGLGVRVTARGARSFILRYRTRSARQRLITIGPAGEWKTSQAREHAKNLKARIRSEPGFDPLAEITSERTAPTVADLAKRFLAEHAARKRPSTRDGYAHAYSAYILPALKHAKVAEVRYADVDALHRRVTEAAGPYQANRIIACLSKSFSLAIRWQWCIANPCKGIERNHEEKRKRYLSGDEIVRLTEVLNKYPDRQVSDIVRMLLLTGARKGEVLSARWDELDLEQAVWSKPASTTKQKSDHTVPLAAPVLQLLTDIRAKAKKDSPWVFPGRKGEHRQTIADDWLQIRREASLGSARVHDLRHSFASVCVSSGMSLPLIGSLLGHSNPQTTNRYAHLLLDSQRKAVQTVASIIAPSKPPAEVIKHPKVS